MNFKSFCFCWKYCKMKTWSTTMPMSIVDLWLVRKIESKSSENSWKTSHRPWLERLISRHWTIPCLHTHTQKKKKVNCLFLTTLFQHYYKPLVIIDQICQNQWSMLQQVFFSWTIKKLKKIANVISIFHCY